MKRYLLLVSLLCFFRVSWSQVVKVTTEEFPLPGTITDDTLYYSFRKKLRWDDFTGKVRRASPSDALSFPGFSYHATIITMKDTIYVHVYLQVYFVRNGSWVRSRGRNAYALSHEQLHFDIAKLAEEHFKDSLLHKAFDPEYYPIEIHFLYWDYWRKMNEMQKAFDDETGHGTNHAQEAKWEDEVRQKLQAIKVSQR